MENRRMKNFKELYCFQNLFHNLRETFYKLQQIEQDACTGVHSACRREEMCTTPFTAQAGANAGISWSYGGEGGLDLQIWDLNRAHETETTVFPTTGFQHV